MNYAEDMKQAIREAIIARYGKIDSLGCYSGKDWLSTEDIYELVCDIIDENDYMFEEG